MPSSSTTTSWPSSTSRLARSIASSATMVWSLGRAVERRGDDLALGGPLEVGDLLGPLVDEDDHQVALGVVGHDRVGDRLHDHGLAGLGRRDDQAALALADRGGDVDHPADQVARLGLEPQPLAGVERRELGEVDAVLGGLGVGAVHRVDAHHRVELLLALALSGLAHLADDRVAAAQAVLAHHRQRDVDVLGAGQVAAGADEGVVVEYVEDARGRREDVVLEDRGVRLVPLAAGAPRAARRAATGGGAIAVATTPAAAAPAPALVVRVLVLLVLVLLVLVLLVLVLLVLVLLVLVLLVLVLLLALVLALGPAGLGLVTLTSCSLAPGGRPWPAGRRCAGDLGRPGGRRRPGECRRVLGRSGLGRSRPGRSRPGRAARAAHAAPAARVGPCSTRRSTRDPPGRRTGPP